MYADRREQAWGERGSALLKLLYTNLHGKLLLLISMHTEVRSLLRLVA